MISLILQMKKYNFIMMIFSTFIILEMKIFI